MRRYLHLFFFFFFLFPTSCPKQRPTDPPAKVYAPSQIPDHEWKPIADPPPQEAPRQ